MFGQRNFKLKLNFLLQNKIIFDLNGTSVEKKVKFKWKSVKTARKRAITDLNASNGFRDIPFQSQGFEQDGRRHFADF